jgi:peptide deformylase
MNVTVEYTDENGKQVILDAEDILARCICHEVDHLDGILFTDRVKK